MDDYVIGLLGHCARLPSTEVHDRKARDGSKSNVTVAVTVAVPRVRKREERMRQEGDICRARHSRTFGERIGARKYFASASRGKETLD